MPFCPVCRLEYRSGFVECADCGAALVDELPSAPRPPRAHSGGATDVVVARAHGQLLAEMWAELLGSHGVASRMNNVSGVVDTVYPADSTYEILVPAADAARARAILPPAPDENRIAASPRTPTEDEVLEEVDRAIARGDMDLAEQLLSTLEDSEADAAQSGDSH